MIHYVTVHFHSAAWIEPQTSHIARHTNEPYEIWAGLDGVDAAHHSRFHHVFTDLGGEHGDKLNAIADEIVEVADPDDILIFVDGDAFPVDDVGARLRPLLKQYPLVGVQRREHLGDIQPHPSFTATTVGFWNEFELDWSRGGKPWVNDAGQFRIDAGARILARLEGLRIEWYPLLRSNRTNLHPVMFGVYADLVYHHGAGFRKSQTAADAARTGHSKWRTTSLRHLGNWRLQRQSERNLEVSERIYAELLEDADAVRRLFIEPGALVPS